MSSGVTDYLADRFAVVGAPEECRAKVAQISESGADVLQITAISHDPADIIRRFGEEVISQPVLVRVDILKMTPPFLRKQEPRKLLPAER